MKSRILISDKTRIFVSTLLFITLIIGAILASTKTKANVVMNEVSLAVPVSCSMSSTINPGNEHTDTIMPGTYTGNIGTTDIKVICNDFSGFSIYAIGYTNNTEGNNTMLGTNTNQTIITGTNTSGNTSNWAMKLAKSSVNYNLGNLSILDSYDAYHAVPSTLTKVAEYKASTGSSTTDQTLGSNIQTTYAAFISGAQAPDTYVGKVKYILIHPATLIAGNYSIAYYAAGGSGTMDTETVKNYEPHTLATNTFTAPAGGYTFKGWCTAQDSNATPSSPQTTCDGISYDPGAIIPVGSEAANSTLNLYAVWNEPMTFNKAYAAANKTKYNNGDYYAMQDMTPGICSDVDDGQVGTLIDTRGTDKQIYTVAKLADGKCWMVENLNLAGGTALSPNDTDVTGTYISGFTTDLNLTKDTLNGTISLPASATAGFNNDSNAFVYNSGNKTNCGGLNQNTQCYSYYSWIAATLGGKQANGTTAQTSNGYNAAASICPKGWKLPTSTTSNANAQTSPNWKTGDWYALAKAYGANLESNYYQNAATFYDNAGPVNNSIPNFLLAGYYYYGSFYYGGSGGFYWSSTSNSSTSAYYLYFGSSYVGSAGNDNRRYGFSVRCLAAPSE